MAIRRFSPTDGTELWTLFNQLAEDTESEISDALDNVNSYTPVWTHGDQPVNIGNGSLDGRWVQVGKLVSVVIRYQRGTTTGMGSNTWRFTLPFNARMFEWLYGSGMIISAARVVPVSVYGVVPGAVSLGCHLGRVAWGTPGDWTSDDRMIFGVTYERA